MSAAFHSAELLDFYLSLKNKKFIYFKKVVPRQFFYGLFGDNDGDEPIIAFFGLFFWGPYHASAEVPHRLVDFRSALTSPKLFKVHSEPSLNIIERGPWTEVWKICIRGCTMYEKTTHHQFTIKINILFFGLQLPRFALNCNDHYIYPLTPL
jgi:hypothetical protein